MGRNFTKVHNVHTGSYLLKPVVAVTFPNSYRIYPTRQLAILSILGLIVFLNIWTRPGIIHHIINSPPYQRVYKCKFDFSKDIVWANATAVAFYLVPNFLVVAFYSFIFYKVRNQDKTRVAPVYRTHPNSGLQVLPIRVILHVDTYL